MSYRDMLTGMYNRHKYGEMLNKLGKKDLESVGIAYIDLNGLKQINDTNSHEKGDVFIKNAAKVISEVFPKSSYRIGGDEFIVLESNTKKEKFEAKLQNLKQKAKQNNVSFSVGFSNKQKGDSLEEKLKEAERGMYTQKQEYYKNRDRRKTPNV